MTRTSDKDTAPNNKIIQFIELCAVQAGLRKTDGGDLIGVSRRSWYNMRSGMTQIKNIHLLTLSERTGIPRWLIFYAIDSDAPLEIIADAIENYRQFHELILGVSDLNAEGRGVVINLLRDVGRAQQLNAPSDVRFPIYKTS